MVATLRLGERKVDFSKKMKGSKTVPDQSMSVKDIVEKFIKTGLTPQRLSVPPVYDGNNNAEDLEALARLDPTDKALKAAEFAALAKQKAEQIEDLKRESDAKKREDEDAKLIAQHEKAAKERGSGIGSLDNTMPVDTGLDASELANTNRGRKK